MKTVQLPCFGITLTINDGSGTITSNLKEPLDGNADEARFNAAIDGIESLILAAACEGIDVTTPASIAAIETAVEAVGNNT